MFRSPLGRNLATRLRRVRRFALVTSLLLVAASLPFISHGAGQGEEVQPRRKSAQTAAKGQANIVEGAEFVPGEVLVRFRTDAAAKTAEAAPASLRAEDGGGGIVTFARFEGSDIVRGLRLARVEPERTLEAVRELAARPDVLYAEPNYIWRATATPNDPCYANVQLCSNIGATGGMYGLQKINAPAAWDVTQGSNDVVVGVLDGGVDINHPDLQENIWKNPGEVAGNGVDDDQNGYVDDINGWDYSTCGDNTPIETICGNNTVFDNQDGDDHATHVAGTIGARGNNNTGVVGVNWRVSIMSVKVLGPDGGNTANIIRGYKYALSMRQRGVNLRVLNNSYGGSGKSLSALAAIKELNDAGILFVVSAGNGGGDGVGDDNFSLPDYPSNYDSPNVIAVASTNSGDTRSGFSNFSSRLVSIGAPGSSILSTTPNNTYSFFGGTSMAAPHVAGAAALVVAAKPGISVSELRGVIAYTGDRISALNGITTTGRRLNVANAVQSALANDSTAPGTAGNLRVAARAGRSITLEWTAPGDDGNAGTAADYDFFFVNPTTQARVMLPVSLVPAAAGTLQSAAVTVPFRNFSGTIQLRAYDNAGNSSTTSVAVSVLANSASDPYTVALSAAQSLTSGGTNLFAAFNGNIDDKYTNYTLPAGFNFPFYGVNRTQMTVSTNGTLYFSSPQTRDDGDANDAGSAAEDMQGQTMIAGLWDDIDLTRTRRADSGVYVSQPDANRLVFRWQGVTFGSGSPINFEIELRRDGTIQMRYGTNTGIFPVVGISGGEPDAYIVASHTFERTPGAPSINLTNAQTVTFSVRPPSISGQVAVNGITGLAGVTLTLSGSQTGTVVTDANGNYSFDVLLGGNYTVTPSRANYTFAPPAQNFSGLGGSQTANFVAVPNRYTISGSVTDAGAGVAGVTVTLSGTQSGATTTDANGNYSFGNLIAEGNYTVVPSKPDFAFAPVGRTFTNLSGSQTGANFAVAPPEPNVLQFSAPSYQFSEGAGRATITVTRGGNTSGTITVALTTVDDPASVSCATSNGTAYARCDYATTIETVTFTAGDTVKTVTIPLIDDAHVEQPETLQIRLLNPVNAQLGAQGTATLTISDNGDAPGAPNPVFGTPFFVRQQYLDFLSREPEPGEPWSAVLNNCPDVNNNPTCDRLTVSKSFFKSPEFQLKGFFVYRFYGLSFGRLPLYTEIVADMRSVTGETEDEVYQKKGAFSNNWVQRPAFKAAFDNKSSTDFVNAMMNSYALQTITTPDPQNPDRGAKMVFTRASLIALLSNGTLTRAQVVRAIADSDEVFALEYNRAYVAMQYFGYLRRDPDAGGFNAWLNYLQANPTDDRTMVRGFANSQEYQLRFGQTQ
ncbi:MAG TPA: S8 family serine peptidase [Pyrinomonadaceae bacterium]|nr:S8 family serine peptidase [Pyrinomonadaceae bacterium]